ncbi:hypothetical protein ACFRQM_35405 [Streptomyces sp. NPDC056831]
MLMSAQGRTVKDITTLMQVGEDYVRDVIHAGFVHFKQQRLSAVLSSS